nr:senescence/dehydration-associated protein At4g35985, chloroplastic-like [Ipomoea batatas]
MNCFRPKTPKNPQMPQVPITQQESSRAVTHELLPEHPGIQGPSRGRRGSRRASQRRLHDMANSGRRRLGGHHRESRRRSAVALTRDEPVVKLAALDYLFTIPVRDGKQFELWGDVLGGGLEKKKGSVVDWKEFAPRVDDYNNFLAKAIAGGTGQIVKGIFICSNAYANQLDRRKVVSNAIERKNSVNGAAKKSAVNNSLKRARKLSQMTEKMSKAMLDGVGVATGSIMGPMVRSQAGKKFLSMVPGEVLLASLDAVNKVLDAAEAAERQAFSATSGAVTKMVSQRFGENAGEATQDALATAGHTVGTAWNVFKIRKAITPGSSVTSGVRNAAKNSTR